MPARDGEFRHRVEAGEGIVAQKQVGGALLARREGVHLEPDALGEARRVGRREATVVDAYRIDSQPLLDGSEKLYQKFQNMRKL